MGNILEVKNLKCGYDNEEVIKNVSFGVEKGRFVGIAGPNGAGKTTLFRVITRILKPWQGTVYYQSNDIQKYPAKYMAREIAVLPQMFDIMFSYTVDEFVLMGRYPHIDRLRRPGKVDWRIIEESMIETETIRFRKRRMDELSGGEMQRVHLAQALAQQPSLLLLDEPTTHLDISHQVEILDLLKKLNQEKGITLVVVLHDLNLVSEYCDRLLLLKDGWIYKKGTPETILTYQNIEDVYKTTVIVEKSPVSDKPHVFLVPGNLNRNRRE